MPPIIVRCGGSRSNGTVLIVVMWIVLVLAGLLLVFARTMRVELIASANHVAELQAESAARAALQYVLSQVDGTDGALLPLPAAGYEAVQVGDGFFWLLDPSLGDDRAYVFGIRDEASRINLNAAAEDLLLKLPGMTAELADSIADWRDPDDEVSPGGAESEHYLLLPDPYYCKNAPFETVDEVLLVKDASPVLLSGEDANLNGVLDPNEDDAAAADPPDDRDGRLDRGLLHYCTVYSTEPNESTSGEARISVNEAGGQRLAALLRRLLDQDRFPQVMALVQTERPFRNILDFYLRTELTAAEFGQVAGELTTARGRTLVGLVNVNTAPREVLLCLPGLEESDVDELLARRSAPDTDLTNIAWVAEALPREKAVAIGGLITARSFQFSADIVAVSRDGRAFRRHLAVVDARTSPPRVLYWRDLTSLGWPLSPDLLTAMRHGEPPVASPISVSGG
jgi:type II secretory pathway component PulK